MSHAGSHVLWGQMRGSSPSAYYRSGETPDDVGAPIPWRVESNPIYPAGPGGEVVLRELPLILRHTMGGTVKVSPIVNGEVLPQRSTVIGGLTYTVETLPVRAVLPQQAADAEMRTCSLVIPLVRRLLVEGVEVARWYLRGERFAVRIEPEGAFGQGSLTVDGVQIDYVELRRADHGVGATAVAGTGGASAGGV